MLAIRLHLTVQHCSVGRVYLASFTGQPCENAKCVQHTAMSHNYAHTNGIGLQFISDDPMAMIPKIHIVAYTFASDVVTQYRISTEQYHLSPTGVKHRVREATSLRNRQGACNAISSHTGTAWACRTSPKNAQERFRIPVNNLRIS